MMLRLCVLAAATLLFAAGPALADLRYSNGYSSGTKPVCNTAACGPQTTAKAPEKLRTVRNPHPIYHPRPQEDVKGVVDTQQIGGVQ